MDHPEDTDAAVSKGLVGAGKRLAEVGVFEGFQ
jgi:hypothetical protein